ncbi:ectoine hydroxylase [Amycolatopsis carbonis]|uniref:Ectoine hydroxylase n=1 Tax=Amycolatopsis carbonis TaxID=715471 RepID=A0A9Y2IDF4_9PSEU|nr:ectoine hydroxylase [Amycolatopsis sp. 2-15]WIX77070.1 ectoine hydroxylase [Amycolatopsis sp. 2-15]
MTVTERTTEDRYPTRLPHAADLVARADPTVWPGRIPGPFTVDDLAGFDRHGYLVVKNLLGTDEVTSLQTEAARLADDSSADDPRVIREKRSGAVRSVFQVHRTSTVISALVRNPAVLDRARQILGSEVYVHQSRINFMPGFTGEGFYWHSDFETWHAEDGLPAPRAVSMSLALSTNFPYNGGLMVIPGSHRTFVPCIGETPADHYQASLREQEIGVPARHDIEQLARPHGIDQFTGPAGSALWFDSNVLHGSGNNITPFPRSNVFVVFNSVENTPVEPFAAPARRPDYVAERDFTPLDDARR